NATLTPSSATCNNYDADRSVGTWMTVGPLTTSTFQGWANTPATNLGLALTASSTDILAWKIFTSRNGPSGKAPYLEVTYSTPNAAPQVDSIYPTYGASVPTVTPELVVSAHDPDSTTSTLTYTFKIYDEDDTLLQTKTQTAPNWQVPATAHLKWDKDYT